MRTKKIRFEIPFIKLKGADNRKYPLEITINLDDSHMHYEGLHIDHVINKDYKKWCKDCKNFL